MLLDGKHDYVALDIKQGLSNSCTNKILLNITMAQRVYDVFQLKKS